LAFTGVGANQTSRGRWRPQPARHRQL